MSGNQRRAARSDRLRLLGYLALLSAISMATGFAVGALLGGARDWLRDGLVIGVIAAASGWGAFAVVWRMESRRARGFGLDTDRWMKLGREVRRGTPPTDPAVRPAVLEILARRRRTLEQQRASGWTWLRLALIVLWLSTAVFRALDGSYALAALFLVLSTLFLLTPLTLRRQERRLAAAARALRAEDAAEQPSP
ncbi:hypothetical protein [Streptomyces sp. NPDC003717]|uniref:hypothetical protein n=1 Tax=Streptomyces sp. NPDC003717 TaxID=3154276 RepID=UPI0033BC6FB1